MFTPLPKNTSISIKSNKCDELIDSYFDLGMLFGTDGVEDYIESINRSGLKIVKGYSKTDLIENLTFEDPSGNLVELITNKEQDF